MIIKNKVMSAIGWSSGTKLIGQLATWVTTIFVMRLLSPEDYGLIALAMMFITIFGILSDMGMGAVIVHATEIDDRKLQRIFGFVLFINFIIFVVLYFAAPIIAYFFTEPRLILMVRLLSLQFLLLAFETIPRALLVREMEFKKLSILNLASVVAGGFVSLYFAYNGYGAMSLVYAFLFTASARVIGTNLINIKFILPIFSIKEGLGDLKFGSLVSMDKVLLAFQNNSDVFVIGKLLGNEILGYYSVAMHFASLPMQRAMGTINPITMSAFSKVKSSKEEISYYFLKVVRISSFFTLPIFLGISVISPQLINVVLGSKWSLAILPMQVLCFIMPLRVVANLLPIVLKGIGSPGISIGNTFFSMSVMVVSFIIAGNWGILGVCMVWLCVYPIIFIVVMMRSKKVIGVDAFGVSKVMSRPLVCALMMYAGVWLFRSYFLAKIPGIQILILDILIGAAIYIVTSLLIQKETFSETINLLRKPKG